MSSHIENLAYAYGQPTCNGILKQSPSDFIVTEKLSFTPSGEGEHLFLSVQKTNLNTLDVCEKLAQHFKLHPKYISYAGLKDKNAVTTQWFSLPFPVKSSPDFNGFESDSLRIIESTRNNKKLKRGAIKNNYFEITIHKLQGNNSEVESRIALIKEQGVPNYFGPQRFGKNENNLENAKMLFSGKIKCGRNKKSIYISAARSFLFNEVVSQRVKNNTWNKFIKGDVAVLNNSHSFFKTDEIDADIIQRLQQGDIHPSAPLWGKGELLSSLGVKELEEAIASNYPVFYEGLIKEGLRQDRRAMRLIPLKLQYQLKNNSLFLSFALPSGTYATSVLREIISIHM